MKTLGLALLLLGALTLRAYSECRYFRVTSTLVKCAAADPKTFKSSDPYPAPETSDLDDPGVKTFAQTTCSCDYSLSGADPLCDPDQTLERSSLVGTANPELYCRRGVTLCHDVCPDRLP